MKVVLKEGGELAPCIIVNGITPATHPCGPLGCLWEHLPEQGASFIWTQKSTYYFSVPNLIYSTAALPSMMILNISVVDSLGTQPLGIDSGSRVPIVLPHHPFQPFLLHSFVIPLVPTQLLTGTPKPPQLAENQGPLSN